MKLSLILQAIDRWSRPTEKAAGATRDLTRSTSALDRAMGKTGARIRRFATDQEYAERVSFRFGRALRTRVGNAFDYVAARAVAARSAVRGFAVDVVKSAARSAVSLAKWGLVGAAAGAGAFVGGIIGQAAKFEQFQVALEGTEGSAEKARKAMAWVREFAQKTPYEIGDVTEAFVRARGVGIDPTTGAFRKLGDAASAISRPLIDAIEMMADAQTFEFERLKAFNVTTSVKGAAVTFSYLDKAGKNASKTVKKTASDVQAAILDILDDKYAGGMERQSHTLIGIWNNLKDVITDFQVSVAGKGFFDKVKGSLQGVLDWTTRLKQSGKLDKWAGDLSNWLSEIWDKAERFVKGTDWAAVARGVGGITSALMTLVSWIVSATQGIGDMIAGFQRAEATMILRNKGRLFGPSKEQIDWANGVLNPPKPQPQAQQRGNRTIWPQGSFGPGPIAPRSLAPSDVWKTPSRSGSPWTRGGGAPIGIAPAKPQKASLEIKLTGDGARQARVGAIKGDDNLSVAVLRGKAMGGPA